jgi:ribosome-binding factor A
MKTEKNIEEFTKYIMKEANVEKPSADFVNKVMNSVKMESDLSVSKVYQPLISKSAWAAITVAFVALYIFILTGTSQDSLLIPNIHFTLLDKISSINLFERIHLSETFTFSFVLFSILVILQLIVIKNYRGQ